MTDVRLAQILIGNLVSGELFWQDVRANEVADVSIERVTSRKI